MFEFHVEGKQPRSYGRISGIRWRKIQSKERSHVQLVRGKTIIQRKALKNDPERRRAKKKHVGGSLSERGEERGSQNGVFLSGRFRRARKCEEKR